MHERQGILNRMASLASTHSQRQQRWQLVRGGGGILKQPGAPPIVRDAYHLRLLRKQGYRTAFWMRDPFERVMSMYTGTKHAGGPDPATMSLDSFIFSALPRLKDTINEHFQSQVAVCNFNVPAVSASAPVWDVVATSGDNQTDTFQRVSLFVKQVFGEAVYERIASKGWGPCSCGGVHWWVDGSASCIDQPFFAPHTSHSESLLHKFTPAHRAKIEEMYAEDVAYYALQRATRERSGLVPGDVEGCFSQRAPPNRHAS